MRIDQLGQVEMNRLQSVILFPLLGNENSLLDNWYWHIDCKILGAFVCNEVGKISIIMQIIFRQESDSRREGSCFRHTWWVSTRYFRSLFFQSTLQLPIISETTNKFWQLFESCFKVLSNLLNSWMVIDCLLVPSALMLTLSPVRGIISRRVCFTFDVVLDFDGRALGDLELSETLNTYQTQISWSLIHSFNVVSGIGDNVCDDGWNLSLDEP